MTDLKIRMSNFKNTGDVKWPMASTAGIIHHLGVDIAWRCHDDNEPSFIIEEECSISNLATWKQEIILRTDGIYGQIVNLRKIKKNWQHFQPYTYLFQIVKEHSRVNGYNLTQQNDQQLSCWPKCYKYITGLLFTVRDLTWRKPQLKNLLKCTHTKTKYLIHVDKLPTFTKSAVTMASSVWEPGNQMACWHTNKSPILWNGILSYFCQCHFPFMSLRQQQMHYSS